MTKRKPDLVHEIEVIVITCVHANADEADYCQQEKFIDTGS